MRSLVPHKFVRLAVASGAAALALVATGAPPEPAQPKPAPAAEQPRKPDVQPPATTTDTGGIALPDHSVRQRIARSLLGDSPTIAAPASKPGGVEGAAEAPAQQATIHVPGVKTDAGPGYIAVPLNTNGRAREIPMTDGTVSVALGEQTGRSDDDGEYASQSDVFLVGTGSVLRGFGGLQHPRNACLIRRAPSRPLVDQSTDDRRFPDSVVTGIDPFNDSYRAAQLSFSEAAAPHLAGAAEDSFRSAQFRFNQATLTQGIQRAPDGLRHEFTTSPARSHRAPRHPPQPRR
jgi:hypothetical protein